MVRLDEVLLDLKFDYSESRFCFDFGSWILTGVLSTDHYFRELIYFSGSYITSRRAAYIEFELPLLIESREMAIAILAHNLRSYEFQNQPQWITEGLELADYLPGRKEQAEFTKIPKASLEVSWFRLISKKLRELAKNSTEDDLSIFSFDGEVFKIVCNGQVLICQGAGKAWDNVATIKTQDLDNLAKRITSHSMLVYIQKGFLVIGGRWFSLTDD